MLFDFRCQTTTQIFPLKETHKVRAEESSTMGINKICLQKPALSYLLYLPEPGFI